jgi:hypothetical protein
MNARYGIETNETKGENQNKGDMLIHPGQMA